jgi:hypothetical protein
MRKSTRVLGAWVVLAPALLAACVGEIGGAGESSERGPGSPNGVAPGGAGSVPGFMPGGKTPGSTGSTPGAGNTPGGGNAGNNPGTDPGDDPTGGTPSPTDHLECVTKAVGPSVLRRMTHVEYDNAVNALLGDQTHPGTTFPIDTQAGLFDNTAETQTVPELLADKYISAAADLAEGVTNMTALVGCDLSGTSGASCAQTFITKFGRKAYRRPLTEDEVTSLVAVYNDTKANSDATTGARAVIAAVLASPHFLFRPEFGTTTSAVPGSTKLSQFEVASRLGSLLWASIPDDTLLDAAGGGKLSTPEQVATQARRMLADPKARPAIAAFYDQWLGLSMLDTATKDPAVFPAFDDTLRNSMREETRRFVSDVLWNGDSSLSTLLSSTSTFVNKPLAALYGVTGPADANTFTRVTLNSKERAGILTQASMLASFARPDESSPVKRGKWVRVRLLCQDLPDPPANVPQLPPPKEGVSTRERFAMHTNNPACSTCHSLIDGLGFGLEQYDGIGRFRTVDRGVPVDSSGEVTETGDIDQPYVGGAELAALLTQSDRARNCAPTQWLRYVMARRETRDDTCSIVALRDAFKASGGNLKELLVSLTQTDAFLNYKKPN